MAHSGKTSQPILEAAKQLEEELPAIPEAHFADCIKIQNELQLIDIDLTPRQIHALWARWSRRNRLEWVSPEKEIVLCLMSFCTGQEGLSQEQKWQWLLGQMSGLAFFRKKCLSAKGQIGWLSENGYVHEIFGAGCAFIAIAHFAGHWACRSHFSRIVPLRCRFLQQL